MQLQMFIFKNIVIYIENVAYKMAAIWFIKSIVGSMSVQCNGQAIQLITTANVRGIPVDSLQQLQ